MLLNWLQRPYYFEENRNKRLRLNVVITLFIFLFLFFFRPFQLDDYPDSLVLLCLGFALVTLLVCAFWMLLLPALLSNWFDSEHWMIWKHLIYLSGIVLSIGTVNVIYSAQLNIFTLSWANFWRLQLYTFSLAIFPIIGAVFFEERRQSQRHTQLSSSISKNLNQQPTELTAHQITLTASNEETLTLNTDSIFYLKSDANYIEVVYQKDDELQKKLLRNTLKAMEEQLSSDSQFFRCHRSYLVDLDKVTRISGNAQGLKLHLKGTEKVIPVSRKHNDFLKNRFAIRP
jgi:hypothetical protein